MSTHYDIQESTWETNELDTQIINEEHAYHHLRIAARYRDMSASDAEDLVNQVKDSLHLEDDFDWSEVDYDDLAKYWNQGVE